MKWVISCAKIFIHLVVRFCYSFLLFLAHEYRLAKNNGDEKAMHSSKSLLNLLSKSKSKRASNKSPHSARSSAFELSQSTKDMNASMERFLDSNAQSVADDNSVADESPSSTSHPNGSGNAIGVTTPSSSFTRGLQPKIRPAKLEDSDDSDAGEILSDSEGEYDEHDDDDDDDDYGKLLYFTLSTFLFVSFSM